MGRAWTQKEIAFLHKHSPKMSRDKLWLKFIDRFDYRTSNAIKAYCNTHGIKGCSDGQFKKGCTPHNKGKPHNYPNSGQFKKGESRTARPIGSEQNSKDGYVRVKVADPNVWRAKHQVVYEQHFGKIPKGYVIRFKDGDKYNFDPNNLIAIPKGASMILNSCTAKIADLPMSEPLINLAYLKYLIGKV